MVAVTGHRGAGEDQRENLPLLAIRVMKVKMEQ